MVIRGKYFKRNNSYVGLISTRISYARGVILVSFLFMNACIERLNNIWEYTSHNMLNHNIRKAFGE